MSRGYAPKLAAAGGPSPAAGGPPVLSPGDRGSTAPTRSARAATPYHCPFCGEEDLRPVEDDATAWSCRSCARVFTVALVRVDYAAIPAHRPHQDSDPHHSEQSDLKRRDR